ncbi:MAG: efflux RND transporter periplasmic adaptor subunit, partial [Geminicoccaceae bacterium]
MMNSSARLVAFLLICIGSLVQTSAAGFEVERQDVADRKIVFATVESTDVTMARARIGGTLQQLAVDEGDRITRGQRIAVVVDEKLP